MATKMYKGADLHCYYQRNIDWSKVAESNLEFFIVQISRGSDPLVKMVDGVQYRPDSQISGVRSIGRMLGGYHFCTATGGSPEEQAATFAGELRRWCALDIPPMFDVEGSGGFDPRDLSTHQFVMRFYRAMGLLGFPMMGIYSNAYFLQNLDMELHTIPGLLVWAADYATLIDGTPAPLRFYDGPCDVRQYSSKGRIEGIGPEFVDLDHSDLGFTRFWPGAVAS